MKTIGTCKDCKWWGDDGKKGIGVCNHEALGINYYTEPLTPEVIAYDDSYPLETREDFGCVHWEGKNANPNYLAKSDAELLNEDLQRENDCAAEKIRRLSEALYELGVDPTQI